MRATVEEGMAEGVRRSTARRGPPASTALRAGTNRRPFRPDERRGVEAGRPDRGLFRAREFTTSLAPRGAPSRRRAVAAFSLLEVMLAVTILALVVTAVTMTWSTALKGWKHGTQLTEGFQREQVVLDTLDELAQSAVLFPVRGELYRVIGARDPQLGATVSFVTASDLLLPASESIAAGMRRVTLALQRGADGQTYLGIHSAPALAVDTTSREAAAAWHVLSADVVVFEVQYRHPRSGEWLAEWTEAQLVPAAMIFTVGFRVAEPGAPPLVVTRGVELPTAEFALQTMGQSLSTQDTTNQVVNPGLGSSPGGDGSTRKGTP